MNEKEWVRSHAPGDETYERYEAHRRELTHWYEVVGALGAAVGGLAAAVGAVAAWRARPSGAGSAWSSTPGGRTEGEAGQTRG
jgi:hypothetical protein